MTIEFLQDHPAAGRYLAADTMSQALLVPGFPEGALAMYVRLRMPCYFLPVLDRSCCNLWLDPPFQITLPRC